MVTTKIPSTKHHWATYFISAIVVVIVALFGVQYGYYLGKGEIFIPSPVYVGVTPTATPGPTPNPLDYLRSKSSFTGEYTFSYWFDPKNAAQAQCPFQITNADGIIVDLTTLLGSTTLECDVTQADYGTPEFRGWANGDTLLWERPAGLLKAVNVASKAVTQHSYNTDEQHFIAVDKDLSKWLFRQLKDAVGHTVIQVKGRDQSVVKEIVFDNAAVGELFDTVTDPYNNGFLFITRKFDGAGLKVKTWFKYLPADSLEIRDLYVTDELPGESHGCEYGRLIPAFGEVVYKGVSCLTIPADKISPDGTIHFKL